jgi:putative flippase GtrA
MNFQKMFPAFIRFCIVGGISAILDLLTLTLLVELLHAPVLFATACSFSVGTVNGFLLNKYYTFKERSNRHLVQSLLYIGMSLIALFLTLIVMKVLVDILLLHYFVSRVITILVVILWTFSANHIIFRPQ